MLLSIETKRIGLFRKTHGIEGELLLQADEFVLTEEELESIPFLFVICNGGMVPYKIDAVRLTRDASFLVKLEEVNDDISARILVGEEVFVEAEYMECIELMEDAEEIDAADAGYNAWLDFALIDQDGKRIGVITGYSLEVQKNPLFIVDEKMLIPIHPDLVIAVDEDKKELHYLIHEGLLDL